jgi:hypothetical protein
MNLSATRTNGKLFSQLFNRIRLRPGVLFALIILVALVSFEVFNYSTTDYAMRDLLGDLRFAGIRWSTILAIAFCGIDFAGIARLFTPEQRSEEPKEVWYLFGAWLLAATMNAGLTWWGVSMAIANHSILSTAVIDQKTLTSVVPVFVALMVWVIRILIIGSLSVASDRLFGGAQRIHTSRPRPSGSTIHTGLGGVAMAPRPTSPRSSLNRDSGPIRPEPSYHNVNARPAPKPGAAEGSRPTNSTYRL